jgi:hypothetical protein
MDIYKNIKSKESYDSLLKSGMFWEFHPELSGEWEKDRKIIHKNYNYGTINDNKR